MGNSANPHLKQSRALLDCGCEEPTAILDFILWKTIMFTSNMNGEEVTKSVCGMVLDPKVRLFIVSAILQLGHLTYDDFFDRDDNGEPKEPASRELQMLKAQYSWIGARITEIEGKNTT